MPTGTLRILLPLPVTMIAEAGHVEPAQRAGTVVSPLFSAFGPEPIATRVNLGSGSVLVTSDALYERKIAKWRDKMPSLRHVLLVAEDGGTTDIPATLDLATLLAAASDDCVIERTEQDEMSLLHFTSGTTGTPKGARHVHGAVVTHWATGSYALDLHDDDVYWRTADPGWVTVYLYGIIAPLLHGVASIVDREEFDAERWKWLLQQQRVSVWCSTAPTAIRMLMKAGTDLARSYAFPQLRFVASVGEPLNPEAVWWGKEALGLPIHDNWWQTETGGIMIANTAAFDIKPGSMGRPLPGVDAAILRCNADGSSRAGYRQRRRAGVAQGRLALDVPRYLNDDERYRKCFAGTGREWYPSGDLARRDADGYYWFVGCADDVSSRRAT